MEEIWNLTVNSGMELHLETQIMIIQRYRDIFHTVQTYALTSTH